MKIEICKRCLNSLLLYLRINDENGVISLTNLCMIVVLYKLARTPVADFSDITALAIAVLGYQVKRIVSKD